MVKSWNEIIKKEEETKDLKTFDFNSVIERRQEEERQVSEQVDIESISQQKQASDNLTSSFSEIPEGYKEPDSFLGQLWEGLQQGFISSVKGAFGSFVESMAGQRVREANQIKSYAGVSSPLFGGQGRFKEEWQRASDWGAEVALDATQELLSKPELNRPEDLPTFLEGGWSDERWWGRTIGESAPFILTNITTATIGAFWGVGLPASFMTTMILSKGGSYKEMIDEGIPEEKAELASTVIGTVEAIIENSFGWKPTDVVQSFTKNSTESVIYSSYKEYIRKEIPKLSLAILKQSVEEGSEEVIQDISSNLIKNFIRDEIDFSSAEELGEIFFSGFAASLPLGATKIDIPQVDTGVKLSEEQLSSSQNVVDKTDEAITTKEDKDLKETGTIQFPENDYQLQIKEEIGKMEELPKIELDSFKGFPDNSNFNNSYTRVFSKFWENTTKIWSSKAPRALKIAETQEITNLLKEKQRVYDGLAKRYYDEIVAPITELSAEEKQKIGEMIFKRTAIPEDYRAEIKRIDTAIGQLGQAIVNTDKSLIEQGYLDKSLLSEETFEANLGKYARTLYIKIDPETGERTMTPRSAFTAEGVIDRSAFKRKLTNEEWGANALLYEGKTEKEIKTYTNEELGEIGIDAKEKFGWTNQADYVLANTFMSMSKTYATRQFQKAIVESPQLFSKEKRDGFIPVSEVIPGRAETDIRLGPLNNGYVHPGLKEELNTFLLGDGVDSTFGIFREALAWFKAFKTAGDITTVIRNYLSGALFQTDMAGFPVWTPVNAKRYITSVNSYLRRDSFYKKLRDNGLYGSTYYDVEIGQAEMARIIEKMNLSKNPQKTYIDEMMSNLGERSKDARKIFNYYAQIDNIQRTYLAKCLLESGIIVDGKNKKASIARAIHFANKWELDYRFVPLIAERARKGVAGFFYPFVSFSTLIAPIIAEVLVTRPWVLLKYPIIIGTLNMFASSILGADEEEIENAKPDFLADNDYVVTLPQKDANGDFMFLDMSYLLPWGQPQGAFLNWDDAYSTLRSQGAMSVIISILNNYDSYTGRKIYSDSDTSGQKKSKITEYVIRQVGPGSLSDIINVYNSLNGEKVGFPIEQDKNVAQTVARALGVSVYSGGFNEAYWKIRKKQSEIIDLQREMAEFSKNANISFEERQEKLKEFQEEILSRTMEIQEIASKMPRQ